MHAAAGILAERIAARPRAAGGERGPARYTSSARCGRPPTAWQPSAGVLLLVLGTLLLSSLQCFVTVSRDHAACMTTPHNKFDACLASNDAILVNCRTCQQSATLQQQQLVVQPIWSWKRKQMWVSGLILARLHRASEQRACKMLRRRRSLAMAATTTINSWTCPKSEVARCGLLCQVGSSGSTNVQFKVAVVTAATT